jgi:hypothetical protein
VGVVASEQAWEPVYPPDEPTSTAPTVEDMLADFNTRHPSMQATQRHRVVRIGNRNVPAFVREALNRPRRLTQPVTAGGINVMFYTLAAMFRGSETNGIPRHAARLQQRHDAALGRGGREARLAPDPGTS